MSNLQVVTINFNETELSWRNVCHCPQCGISLCTGRYSIQTNTTILVTRTKLPCCNIEIYLPKLFPSLEEARRYERFFLNNKRVRVPEIVVSKQNVEASYVNASYQTKG